MKLDLSADDTRAMMSQVLKRAQTGKLTQDEFFLLSYCESQAHNIDTLKSTVKTLQAQLFKREIHGRKSQSKGPS